MLSFRRFLLAFSLPLSALSLLAQSTTYTDGENNAGAIAGASTLTIDAGTAEQSGIVSGSGVITKSGDGTLIFSGDNNYSGATVISAGTLQVGNGGSSGNLGTAAVELDPGSTLAFDLSGAFTISKAIAGQGPSAVGNIVQNGSGTVTLSKAVAADAMTVNAGTLVITGSDRVGVASVNGGTLQLSSPGAAANGFGSMVVAGGTLNSTMATPILSGNLTLNSGTIASFGAGTGSLTLSSGNSFAMSGGTFDFKLGAASNQLISAGSGTLTLTGGTVSLDTSGGGFDYGAHYQLFSGFADTSYSALTLSGYDTSLYTASISEGGTLSFSAVPEPASYAAIAGVAALGLAVLHRRKRQPAAQA